jgi:hypothetical protein
MNCLMTFITHANQIFITIIKLILIRMVNQRCNPNHPHLSAHLAQRIIAQLYPPNHPPTVTVDKLPILPRLPLLLVFQIRLLDMTFTPTRFDEFIASGVGAGLEGD